MARKVTPNSWADTTAYIAEGADASAEAVQFGGGQHVKIVDDPSQAQLRIRVSKGYGRFYSAEEARLIAHRGMGARAGSAPPSEQRAWYLKYAIFAAIAWIGVSIVGTATGDLSIGQMFLSLLLTPLVALIFPPMMRAMKVVVFE